MGVQPRNINYTEEFTSATFTVALNTAAGAYGAYLFTAINPVGGAIFGASQAVTAILAGYGANRIFADSPEGKVLKVAIPFFAGLAVAIAVTSLAGYAITFGTAIGLIIAMIPAQILIKIFNCCCLGIYPPETEASRRARAEAGRAATNAVQRILSEQPRQRAAPEPSIRFEIIEEKGGTRVEGGTRA